MSDKMHYRTWKTGGSMGFNGRILFEAMDIVNGKREVDYGTPAECLNRAAAMWSAYLGRHVTGHDVACLMVLLKLAREANRHKHDNLLDAAGYIGLAGDIADATGTTG